MNERYPTVAILGCGKAAEGKEGWAIGRVHGEAWVDRFPAVRLHAVDIIPENLAAFGDRFGISQECLHGSEDSLYESVTPDVISICTWPDLHAPMLCRGIAEGVRGVVCEKPMGLSPREVAEMIKRSEEAGVKVSVAHQRRHNPLVQEVKRLISEKRLGEIVTIECRVSDNWDMLSWTSYWFDLVNCFFDGPPLSLLAGMDHVGERRYRQAVESQSVVFAEYPGGHQGIFITGPDNPSSCPIFVRGDRGVAFVSESSPIRILTDEGLEEIPLDEKGSGAVGQYGQLFAELVQSLEGGPVSLCDVSNTADATLMCYAAHEAARTGRMVTWPIEFEYAPLEVLQNPPKSPYRHLRACLYADGHENEGRIVLQGAVDVLADLVHPEVKVIDARSNPLTRSDLEDIDVLCLFHYEKEAAPETREALRDWIEVGKPVLMLHSSIGAYPDWDDFQRWCGLVWEWGVSDHPYQSTNLQMTEAGHGLFSFEEAWVPEDEIYTRLKKVSDVEPLLTSLVDGESVTRSWINKDFPNIVGFDPGHTDAIWRLPLVEECLGGLIAYLDKRM
ncbi:MAG: Gfo/Idh/MocA family oxidoreductase [Verrucomicrobiota bacterium]